MRSFRFLVRKNCALYRYVVVEPNAYLVERTHQIETADDLKAYRGLVLDALGDMTCNPLFLIKLTPKTTPTMIDDAAAEGCIGCKLYPEGVTTGANHGGISDFHSRQINSCLAQLQKNNMVLQEHPEMPHRFCLRREFDYQDVIRGHSNDFPRLRIFVEHMSDRRTVELVQSLRWAGRPVFGTITGHHKKLTLDDVLGRVDNHCWPCAKTPEDRETLIDSAVSGNEAFISITDSAFWKWGMKHLVCPGCAGVFNPAEIAIPWLVTLFEQRGALKNLEKFSVDNGLRAYGLKQEEDDIIELIRSSWRVPKRYDTGSGTVVPFFAGDVLPWQIVT